MKDKLTKTLSEIEDLIDTSNLAKIMQERGNYKNLLVNIGKIQGNIHLKIKELLHSNPNSSIKDENNKENINTEEAIDMINTEMKVEEP